MLEEVVFAISDFVGDVEIVVFIFIFVNDVLVAVEVVVSVDALIIVDVGVLLFIVSAISEFSGRHTRADLFFLTCLSILNPLTVEHSM